MKKTTTLPPVRVSPVQLARIQAALETSGASLSEFIREATLKEADRITRPPAGEITLTRGFSLTDDVKP